MTFFLTFSVRGTGEPFYKGVNLLYVLGFPQFKISMSFHQIIAGMKCDVLDLVHWSLTHGIIMSCKNLPTEPLSTLKVTHAPFTQTSYNYPLESFLKAKKLAPIFNNLIHKVSLDQDWLLEVLKTTAHNDNFTGRLLQIYKYVLDEGIKQKITLGINRSDYMLHQVESDVRSLLQVEINTIASSFGSLSTKISEMYQRFENSQPDETSGIPFNSALSDIAEGIFAAHSSYKSPKSSTTKPIVLMVVQPGERNVADQRLLQYAIEQHGVECRRATFDQIFHNGLIDSASGELTYNQLPVSVVYYRAGYSPDDYLVTGSENEWDARLMVERSLAIKCPNIAYHLAGTKKVQQALAKPGVLEKFLQSDSHSLEVKDSVAGDISLLRSVFAGLYSLDSAEVDPVLLKRATENPDDYVLKPQREGGGNNLYGAELVAALAEMGPDELSSYILMERIRPPHQTAVLVRDCIPNEVRSFTMTMSISHLSCSD